MTSALYFGLRWGPAADDPSLMTRTPAGELCLRCSEPIAEGDSGLLAPHFDGERATLRAQHRECFLRGILGSVGHQDGKCSCFGGMEEDPPGMTAREAARAAVARSQCLGARSGHD